MRGVLHPPGFREGWLEVCPFLDDLLPSIYPGTYVGTVGRYIVKEIHTNSPSDVWDADLLWQIRHIAFTLKSPSSKEIKPCDQSFLRVMVSDWPTPQMMPAPPGLFFSSHRRHAELMPSKLE
jgi:hypothetical protein